MPGDAQNNDSWKKRILAMVNKVDLSADFENSPINCLVSQDLCNRPFLNLDLDFLSLLGSINAKVQILRVRCPEGSKQIQVLNTMFEEWFLEEKRFDMKIDGSKIQLADWITSLTAEASPILPDIIIQYKKLWLAYSRAVLALCKFYKEGFSSLDAIIYRDSGRKRKLTYPQERKPAKRGCLSDENLEVRSINSLPAIAQYR